MPRLNIERYPHYTGPIQELHIAVVAAEPGEEVFVTEAGDNILLPLVAADGDSLEQLRVYAQSQATLLGKPVSIVPFTRCQPCDIYQPLPQTGKE